MERRPKESYDDYRIRRNKLKDAIKEYLKGRRYDPVKNKGKKRQFAFSNLF